MNNTNNQPAWMQDDLVKNISPKKLEFLGHMFQESQGKTKKEMMTFVMPMMQKAKQENLTFSPAEMNAAITAIKKYSTAEELSQMNKILEKAGHKKMPE